jgi:membrane protein implicated in regulation of membrane protease activity
MLPLNPVLIWFLIGTFFVLAEFAVPGVLLVFFGLGAWIVAVLVAVVPSLGLAWQIGIWLGVSLVLLFTLRSWLAAQFRGFTGEKSDMRSMPSESIGQHVSVIEDIPGPGREGHVRWKGTEWRAVADEAIPAGTLVQVVGQENLVLKVQRIAGE